MPDRLHAGTYYLNHATGMVALISEGVRLPTGFWVRVADGRVLSWFVEQMVGDMFPELKKAPISFVTLTSASDVVAFERSIDP